MSISYLSNLAARIKATAQESVASLKDPIGAVDFPELSGVTPYFALRLRDFNDNPTDNLYNTAEWVNDNRTFTLYLVVGKLQGGYKGEHIGKIYQYEELIIQHFKTLNGSQLISAAYPTAPTYLATQAVGLNTGTGLIVLDMSGIGEELVASSYTIIAPCVAQLF